MSEISTKTQNIKVQALDFSYINDVIYLGDDSTVTLDHITQLPQAALGGKDQNNIASINEIKLGDQANNSLAKWTEKYNTKLDKSIAWTKLAGISSPDVPRPITILGGNPLNRGTFDESGVFIPGSPDQEDDSGEASKILISGLGNTETLLFKDATYSNAYAGYALYPPVSRQLYISSSGDMYIFISLIYSGSAHSRAIYGKSVDGGKHWTWTQVDPTETEGHAHTALAVDKYGDIHFVWAVTDNANVLIKLRHAKLNTKTGVLGSISQISDPAKTWNLCPSIQIASDGEKLKIMWLSATNNTSYPNIYARTVNFNGTLEAIEQVSNDGGSDISYLYITMDIDNNGYRHVFSIAQKNATTEFNIYYKYETGGGWQATQQINYEADETKAAHYISNVLIDKNNNVYIAYDIGPFDSTTKTPLYIRKLVGGSTYPRVTVEAGNPGIGGTIPHMQLDKDNNINIVYMSNTAPDTYNTRKINSDLTIGSRSILHVVEAGHDLSYIHTPTGLFPNVYNINTNVSQQNLFYIYADYVTGSPGTIDIKLGYIENCIMGSTPRPARINTRQINIRGSINKTKFNNMADLAIS
jgi:hypothetical protein